MNKVNPFPAVTSSRPLIFLSDWSFTNEAALVANLGKTSLAKGTVRYISAFLPRSLIVLAAACLNYFRQLSFTKIYIYKHIVSESISYFGFLSSC